MNKVKLIVEAGKAHEDMEVFYVEKVQARPYGVKNVIDTEGNAYLSTELEMQADLAEINTNCVIIIQDSECFIMNIELFNEGVKFAKEHDLIEVIYVES